MRVMFSFITSSTFKTDFPISLERPDSRMSLLIYGLILNHFTVQYILMACDYEINDNRFDFERSVANVCQNMTHHFVIDSI